jgi:hypothetical protein
MKKRQRDEWCRDGMQGCRDAGMQGCEDAGMEDMKEKERWEGRKA